VDPLRILVVEDHADSAASFVMLLRIWGHEVQAAHDGPTALEVARTFSPHVVLLDIGLPRMNGWQVAVRLRQQLTQAMPVLVAVTGYGQDVDRQKSVEAGIDLHLLKPVEPEQLRGLLSQVQRLLAPPSVNGRSHQERGP
jgi:CheY-like chemotaxis protein